MSTTANFSVEDVISAAQELLFGDKAPNLKLALFAAAMSKRQQLAPNGTYTRILAKYAATRLPARDALYEEMKGKGGQVYNCHLDALYACEAWVDSLTKDEVESFVNIGSDYVQQAVWRQRVFDALTGKGMGWKTISFAALILDPLGCELVPVDRHVLARLGYTIESIPSKQVNLYLSIEKQVLDERDSAGYSHVTGGIWHWYKWEEWRQMKDAAKAAKKAAKAAEKAANAKRPRKAKAAVEVAAPSNEVESHKDLSCRWY